LGEPDVQEILPSVRFAVKCIGLREGAVMMGYELN
jgi:hypothetical protein